MRGRASLLAVLAMSCLQASYSIVNAPGLAPEVALGGSMRLKGTGQEVIPRGEGARIATQRLVLRGGAGSTVAAKRVSKFTVIDLDYIP